MQVSPELREKIHRLKIGEVGTLAQTIGIEFIELSKGKVVASMPVDDRTKQPFGILHGGASVALAETVASIGAWLMIDEDKYDALGLEINANHIRAVKSGRVTGTATPIHIGATTHVWEVRIENEDAKLICLSRCTMAIRKKMGK